MPPLRRRPLPRLPGKIPVATFAPLLGTIGSNGAIQAAALLGSVLLARRLGVGVRGEFAAATAWCALLSAFGDLGVSQAVPYRCARAAMAPGEALGTGFVFALLAGGLAALAGAFVVVPFQIAHGGVGPAATLAFLPSIPATLLSTYASLGAQGLGALRTFNGIRLAQSAAYTGGLIGGVLSDLGDAAAILRLVAGLQILVALGSLLAVHRRSTALGWRVRRGEARHLLAYGLKTHLGNLAWMANGKLDQMILSVTVSERALGLYANAASYAGVLVSLVSALGMVVYPKLAAEGDPAERLDRLRRALRQGARLALAVGLPLAALAPWLIPGAFGRGFAGSVLPAVVLVLGAVLLCLNYLLSIGLRAAGHPLLPSLAEGAGLVATAVGLPLVLARFGILGAAWVSVASYAATLALLLRFYRRVRREVRAPIRP